MAQPRTSPLARISERLRSQGRRPRRPSADYNGLLVDALRENDYTLVVDDVTIRLAKEFGFCYGVDRAVEYAYQTRKKFPGRHLVLAGEIIHNPHVNAKLRSMGIEIMEPGADGLLDFSVIKPDDVVILPAFGVTIEAFETLRAMGCTLVDTTCGSVLNVWKRVESYARDGFTALIHGKHYHEETRATASQVLKYPGGSYIVVRHMDEARMVCDYIEGRGTRVSREVRGRVVAGFDPTCTSSASAWRTRRRCWRRNRWPSAKKLVRPSRAPAATKRARPTSAPSTRAVAQRRSGRTP